jgi:hypothetical protein
MCLALRMLLLCDVALGCWPCVLLSDAVNEVRLDNAVVVSTFGTVLDNPGSPGTFQVVFRMNVSLDYQTALSVVLPVSSCTACVCGAFANLLTFLLLPVPLARVDEPYVTQLWQRRQRNTDVCYQVNTSNPVCVPWSDPPPEAGVVVPFGTYLIKSWMKRPSRVNRLFESNVTFAIGPNNAG